MAGPYYMDTAGSNTAPYDTWVKAATSLQTVADLAAAGEIVYCRGTQTLAAAIDFDTNAGSTAAGHILFVGCHADGTANGGQFTLDANSASAHCVSYTSTSNYVHFQNFTFENATGDGLYENGGAPANWILEDCTIRNNGGHGIGNRLSSTIIIRCRIEGNTTNGISLLYSSKVAFCEIRNNGGVGLGTHENYFALIYVGNVIAANSGDQAQLGNGGLAMNNVIDGENDTTSGHGLVVMSNANLVLGNRFTHNDGAGKRGIEVTLAAGGGYEDHNAFFDNTTDKDSGMHHGGNDDTTLADDGYVDRANADYNVKSGADLRSVAIDLDWDT